MSNETNKLVTSEKKESASREENLAPGKHYMPHTDISETKEALKVYMDMPGVKKENVTIKLEEGVLAVEGKIDSEKYKDYTPYYTEYNVGHFSRSFKLSGTVDQEKIVANMDNGVLALTLPKLPEAKPKQIQVS